MGGWRWGAGACVDEAITRADLGDGVELEAAFVGADGEVGELLERGVDAIGIGGLIRAEEA
ncbi:MAG: hypothetical protein QM820_08170 [Minicystis sp.]